MGRRLALLSAGQTAFGLVPFHTASPFRHKLNLHRMSGQLQGPSKNCMMGNSARWRGWRLLSVTGKGWKSLAAAEAKR